VNQKRTYAKQLIDDSGISVKIASKALGLNRSSWYYHTSPLERKRSHTPLDANLVQQLQGLSGYELTLGYRKTADYLRVQFEFVVNYKKMYRHMNQLKLLQPKHIKRPKKRKSPTVMWYCPMNSNQRWEADLTLVPYQEGHLYLFSVIDTYDKELIGSWFGFRCRKEEAIESLRQAVFNRFSSGIVTQDLTLVLRLDRGCQFTAHEFGEAARSFQIDIEFCDVQAPNQKPFIEAFFSNFKREEVYRSDYQNPIQAFDAWAKYVLWYNTKRPHGSLNNLAPVQFRNQNMKGVPISKILPS
jgi:putative transposase